MCGSRHRGHLPSFAVALGLALLLLIPASADAFQAKTNRGGSCTINPITRTQGDDQVTYGVRVPGCNTRNGVLRVASTGLALQGREVVSRLRRKVGKPSYENVRSSNRTPPPDGGDTPLPPLPVPIPPLPDPIIDIPLLPGLPDLPIGGGGGAGNRGDTYTRVDFSVRLARNKGKRARRKPERWRKRPGCKRSVTKYSGDTLVCQFFAPTS